MTTRVRTAVLISGRGSNMECIARAAQDPAYPADIQLVLSNRPQAAGLDIARAMGIDTLAISHRDFPSRELFDTAISHELQARSIEMIVLAGFMRILSPQFIADWPGRILNIHPSLLPKYPGLDTHARAIAAGDSEAGCSVHLVTEVLDGGPVLAQQAVPILPGDDADSLSERVLAAEHRLYPQAVADYARKLRSKA